jgi:hypothetical protein
MIPHGLGGHESSSSTAAVRAGPCRDIPHMLNGLGSDGTVLRSGNLPTNSSSSGLDLAR